MATIDITLDEEWEIWVRKSNIEKAILKKGASQPFAAAVIAGAVSLNQSEEQPTIQLLSGTGLTTNDVKVEILERPRPSNNGLLRLKVKDKGAGAHKIRIRVLENYYSF